MADMIERIDFLSYDWIVVNTSAGKDSMASADVTIKAAKAAGVLDRVVLVHCDLGRIEWEGTKELAEAQAAFYGVPLRIVRRDDDLLHYIERRKMWPSNKARYCTSEFKRAPVRKLYTLLVREAQERKIGQRVKILNVMGFRADESPARKKRPVFDDGSVLRLNKKGVMVYPDTCNGKRQVDEWLPIHSWNVEQVWANIRSSGAPYHFAYDLGMPRLSCPFCIFSSREGLLLAGKHNRGLLSEYVAVEKRIGHSFRQDLTMASIQTALDEGYEPDRTKIKTWTMA